MDEKHGPVTFIIEGEGGRVAFTAPHNLVHALNNILFTFSRQPGFGMDWAEATLMANIFMSGVQKAAACNPHPAVQTWENVIDTVRKRNFPIDFELTGVPDIFAAAFVDEGE